VEGIRASMISLLKSRGVNGSLVEEIEVSGETLEELMGVESQLWREFYTEFSKLLKHFSFNGRNRNPPKDEVNAMISLGNSIMYSAALTEIRKTYLHPAISFLHEPLERRYSLSLDLADIFKPITTFRVILRLVNRGQIRREHFEKDVGVLLNAEGLRVFLSEMNSELERKVLHPRLKRKTSLRYLMRLECYSLVRHFLGDSRYRSLRAWW